MSRHPALTAATTALRIVCLVLLLTGTASIVGGASIESQPWYVQEHARLAELAKVQTAALEKATAAVTQAQDAVAASRAANNSEALALSEKALALAEGSVRRAQAKRGESDTRMKSLASLPIAAVSPTGRDFQVVLASGLKLTGADALTFPLDAKTRVVTGKDGKCQMLLPDKTAFTIGANSDMVLDEFVYDPTGDSRKILVSLIKGTFRWVTGKVADRSAATMKVNTPCGTIGPRGTDFEVAVKPDGSGWVKLYDGAVDITEKKTGRTFTLKPGQMVTHDANGVYSEPKPLERSSVMVRPPALRQLLAAVSP